MAYTANHQPPAAPALDFLAVCPDCLSWLANGDASGLDYSHSEEGAAERLAEIQEGEAELMRTYASVSAGDSTRDEEFSAAPCDCCGTRLAGARAHMIAWQRRP